jgi:hypothetical protein
MWHRDVPMVLPFYGTVRFILSQFCYFDGSKEGENSMTNNPLENDNLFKIIYKIKM